MSSTKQPESPYLTAFCIACGRVMKVPLSQSQHGQVCVTCQDHPPQDKPPRWKELDRWEVV